MTVVGQNNRSTWLFYKQVKSVEYLGTPVLSDYNQKTLVLNDAADIAKPNEIIIDTLKSANEQTEFQNSFKSFEIPFFKSNGLVTSSVFAKNVKVVTVNQKTVAQFNTEQYYVYSGLTADSVNFSISRKKERNLDPVKLLRNLINGFDSLGISMTKLKKFTAIIDSSKLSLNDSFYYKVIITDPEVMYKVQVVRLKSKFTTINDNYKYLFTKEFHQMTFPRHVNLEVVPAYSAGARAKALLKKSPLPQKKYTLTIQKNPETNDLTLALLFIRDISGKAIPYYIEKQTYDSQEFWRLDEQLVDEFTFLGRFRKRVYLSLYAERVFNTTNKNEFTVKIYRQQEKDDVTYITYPEMELEYLR